MSTATLAEQIDERLRALGDPARAVKERAYLKSNLTHYGASVPGIRSVAAAIRRQHPDLRHRELVELIQVLWANPVHEHRMVAVELLRAYVTSWGPVDLDLLERLLRESKTWALVDGLAEHVVGAVVANHPEAAATLDRWADDEDFWLRRSAMLALLGPLRRGEGDFVRFSRYADAMLEEREFFIRKAIGWILRDTGRRRPDLVFEWLLPRASRASGVTIREAVKPLSPDRRAIIEAARRG